jgi:hypothetical protein
MFPGHLDGGSHIVCEDDELRRPAVIMGAEAHDIDLSHSGRENSEKNQGRARGQASVWLETLRCSSAPVIGSRIALDSRT